MLFQLIKSFMINIDVVTFSVMCGFFTVLYLFWNSCKSHSLHSTKLLKTFLSSFNPDPLITSKSNKANADQHLHLFANDNGLLEYRNVITKKIGTTVTVNNKALINLTSDNFLNLIGNKDIENKAIETIRKYGVGSCGPRGFYGTVDVHLDLEERIAKFMNMEEAVVYSYGFSTIASAIPAYCKRKDVIFTDEKISFATQRGIEAAKCQVYYFKHNDVQDLQMKLEQFQQKYPHKEGKVKKFLIVEGLYTSTGQICNLSDMVKLRSKYKMRLFLDESLSFGVLGKTGRGVTEHFAIDTREIDMIISSLEGLLGSIGGFCVGTHFIIEHQRLSGLGYCFSASLPPLLTRAAICGIDYIDNANNNNIFVNLKLKCIQVHDMLEDIPNLIVAGDKCSPIKYITFPSSDPKCNVQFVTQCEEKGLAVTLSPDKSIKIAVNIALTEHDIYKAASIMTTVAKEITESYIM